MPKVYKLEMKKIINSVASDGNVVAQMNNIASSKVSENKKDLVSQFESHPVSKEILGGPEASNLSRTLSGYGNLFSFIGFENGSNPISSFSSFLRKRIRVTNRSKPTIKQNRKSIKFTYRINVPDASEIANNTKMPWESGRSWLYDVERGISGFSNYIYEKLKGRSGGGLESSNPRKGAGNYKPVPYWSKLWANFINKLQE